MSAVIKQAVLGGYLSLSFTQRKNRDELARTTSDVQEDGFRNILMNNQGRSDHKSMHIGWEKSWNSIILSSYVSWSETRTNSNDYDAEPDPLNGQQFVFYQGRRLPYSELTILREDFSRPLVANLAVSRHWAAWLETSVNMRYRAAYNHISATGRNVDGELVNIGGDLIYEQLPEFVREGKPETLMTDLSVKARYDQLYAGATMYNAFDRRTYTVRKDQGGVEAGRYFWVEMGVNF